jgi:methionine biosynthesis protein MetW
MTAPIPLDHRLILSIVEPGSRILDLGCGDGELMELLVEKKQAKAQGVELNEASIYRCVARGLSVFHSDIQSGLRDYPPQSFDYVILNQSLQQTQRADFVLDEALRVGRSVIVGFPNFAHWHARWQLLVQGRSPYTPSLPYAWHDSPNVRFLSLKDFREYCQSAKVEKFGSWPALRLGNPRSFTGAKIGAR